MHLLSVVTDSGLQVDGKIIMENQVRHQQSGPIELKHRDNTPVVESTVSPKEPPSPRTLSPVADPLPSRVPQ
jgi:hypothetical protein